MKEDCKGGQKDTGKGQGCWGAGRGVGRDTGRVEDPSLRAVEIL